MVRLLLNYYYCSVVCLTTGPKLLPKRSLHIVRSKSSSFKWEYPLLSLRSSSSFLRLLPRLLVTSISPFIFPSITCFRRQFLRKMWPIQLAFRFRISRRIFLCSMTLSNTYYETLILLLQPVTFLCRTYYLYAYVDFLKLFGHAEPQIFTPSKYFVIGDLKQHLVQIL